MTDLIIQTLTEDDARTLKEKIFCERGLAKVIKGSYSGTFGLKVSFKDWFSSEYSEIVDKFLYKEPVIKMRPSELGYYEHGMGWNYCEEVDFSELYPTAGIYRLDPRKVVTITDHGVIYYKEKSYCRVEDINAIRIWAEKNNDPILNSGLSKIYRRGFINNELRYKWMNELYPDILAS